MFLSYHRNDPEEFYHLSFLKLDIFLSHVTFVDISVISQFQQFSQITYFIYIYHFFVLMQALLNFFAAEYIGDVVNIHDISIR